MTHSIDANAMHMPFFYLSSMEAFWSAVFLLELFCTLDSVVYGGSALFCTIIRSNMAVMLCYFDSIPDVHVYPVFMLYLDIA